MNKKGKNIELEIYESFGINAFKKMLFKIVYIAVIPFTLEMTKEERHNYIGTIPNNYTMKKGHGLQDLRDFKKCLFFNAGIHLVALSACILEVFNIIGGVATTIDILTTLFWIPTNIYCIMLQRYNYIRIDQTLEKFEPHEEAKKDRLKEELIKEDSLLSEHTYKFVNKFEREKI